MSRSCPASWATCPLADWKLWVKERASWMQEDIDEEFCRFVDKKWKDSLNMAAADPLGSKASQELN
jgi:hypothetical protein